MDRSDLIVVSSLRPVVVGHSKPVPTRSLTNTISTASRIRAQSTGASGTSSASAPQPGTLVEQVALALEPHADGELVAAPGGTSPFQEGPPQQRGLVVGEQGARRHVAFRHQSSSSQ